MREKIKWLSVIEYHGLLDDFDLYRFAHRDISINRAARAFCRKHSLDCSVKVRKEIFINPDCDEDGVLDTPSMKEARQKIFEAVMKRRAL